MTSIVATFVGSNTDGFVNLWGYRFETNKVVEVTDPHAIGKIRGNSEFTWKPGKAAAPHPLDHDGNGAAGGSKAGAESTASKGAARKAGAESTSGQKE